MDQPNLTRGEPPLYTCFECSEPVFVLNKIVYKPCGHKEAGVLANMTAIVSGSGKGEVK
jgi:hypothetical protein